ncbi:MAG: diadenosine tetraphosphate hydrolase [Candidatus Diapherotrites archaeon]|nr:diadenosine tetraphosphate hydrolase [Candidatus Diapherotrites archaeon]MDZ4255974.1 diadenosine tetraphosphate hydrolase [archaeon]
MARIVDLQGKTHSISCIACAIQKGSATPIGGTIVSSVHFRAEQDFEYPIPGFVIIVSKRHFYGIDDMTKNERMDFIEFVSRTRKAMRKTLGVEFVHMILEEDTSSSHFHVWLFPRYVWMEKKFGRKIESIMPIMRYAKKYMKKASNLKEVRESISALKSSLSR